ncbi:3-hydroxyacyl-ACP dehydratase [Empedobacter stercoris]|uniref:3-hydroxyacyl-ACP dehydratase n=1 Tax=Empedobacter falsenii TaxID=343874 RepID=A0ABY8VA99_9FLAO|nr:MULTISPECIES: 3-hydroxyacyl-ACP dehydratase [Empedobacter]MCA4776149.1 3-hydroxyacyl-ACP dehydratase [Empedobacter stercoris]MCA4781586.1 3-hydroxyacyl-ACP dehydratase [Empedobacter stercoris]MDM1523378.1 3-hydroxyacyl-ACP dehydratase [Empedobacter sp. 225-1]MDM1543339.1 3-hydroxyacyl-ACP dehydratase [Empedobacter sp. 189-2]UWX67848.1 3-hydroxyacyl-ACP dehydratase [Empedobacter stercoris]
MLIPNLYTIKNSEKIDDVNFKVQIELNPNHEVFEGHFPNNPITPGVCMMQIIKEITEGFVAKNLFLSKVSNVKFMATINPFVNPILELNLNVVCENDEVKVKNTSFFEATNALKFSAIYKVLD